MLLALRKKPADSAPIGAWIAAWAIKARLVSKYCHGGVVVDGELSHAQPAHGLQDNKAGDWQPDKWVLFDCGKARDAYALELLQTHRGAGYDWLSLLAFIGLRASDNKRMYCFEWCWFAMTGEKPAIRITPEMLIEKAYELKNKS
jgi:hypothetical protein